MFISSVSASYGLEDDYTSTQAIPIEMLPDIELSTKEGIIEGHKLTLHVTDDVFYKETLLVKKDTIVQATIETVITAGMNGFPAEIIIGKFEIPGLESSKILGEYSKTGQNRCLWVYPLKWALTFLPPTGSLTNFIYGGHSNLKTTDKITVAQISQYIGEISRVITLYLCQQLLTCHSFHLLGQCLYHLTIQG